jgi:hypothetical protein
MTYWKELQRKQLWHWSTIPELAWRWWREDSNWASPKCKCTALPLLQPGWHNFLFHVHHTTDTQWTENRMALDRHHEEILQYCSAHQKYSCTNILIIWLDTYYLIHQSILLTKYYLLQCKKKKFYTKQYQERTVSGRTLRSLQFEVLIHFQLLYLSKHERKQLLKISKLVSK